MARKKRRNIPQTSELAVEQTDVSQEVTSAKGRYLVPAVIAVVLLAVLLFIFKDLFVAAFVNGQPVSRMAVTKELEKQGGKKVLDAIIIKTLILQEAKKKGITISQNDIDKQVKKIDESFKKQGQNIDQLLTMQGMTRQDLNDQIREQLILEKLLGDKVKVTDKEIENYMAKNKDSNKDQVKQQLTQQKMQSAAQNLVEKLRKDAKITLFVKY